MARPATLTLLLSAAISAMPLPVDASAAPSRAEIRRASELSANGGKLYAEGSYESAIAAYTAAWDLVEDPDLLYNIALCEEKLGDLEAAADTLDRYRALAPEAERSDLVARAEALREAARRVEEKRIAAEVAETEAAKKREEEAAAAAAAADADANAAAEAREAEARRVAQEAEQQRIAEERRVKTRNRNIGISVGLGALVGTGAIIGGAFGALSLRSSSRAEEMCVGIDGSGPLCPSSAEGSIVRARGQALIADVSFAVAGLAFAGLVVHLAVAGKRKKAATEISLTPGPGYGLGLAGRF